jgi:hypothetical protein
VFVTDKTQDDGSFFLSVPRILKHEEYTVVATMNGGGNVEMSNQIKVSAGGLLSDMNVGLWSIFFALLILVCGLFGYILFHKEKHNHSALDIKKDLKDAENVLHKSFDILREDLTDYIHEKMRSTADRKNAAILEKEIDDAERIIDNKIKDIQK